MHDRYALKCVRKRDVVEKNVQDALVSELSILKEARCRKEQHRAVRVLLCLLVGGSPFHHQVCKIISKRAGNLAHALIPRYSALQSSSFFYCFVKVSGVLLNGAGKRW